MFKKIFFFLSTVLISQSIQSQGVITAPPNASSLRSMAEWEEVQALVITWRSYPEVLREIVRYAQEQCQVIIHCTPSSADSNAVKNNLINNGVAIGTNVKFIQTPTNSIWIRDYGANSVYVNDVDSLILVDWIYNRSTRPQDDTVCRAYARKLNLPVYETRVAPYRIVHTGGNYISDGFGNGFSSKLVNNENQSLSTNQIGNVMNQFMGIDNYILMETLPYDGINHIDMHMKLLDEETLLMTQYPDGVADGPQIEANLLYVLNNHNSVFGTPYEVVRQVSPPQSNGNYPDEGGDYLTYSNSVFINKLLLVPTYREPFDSVALNKYRKNLPGYQVQGINCNNIIQASGAIHCITHSVGVNDPLLISHQKLRDTYNTTDPYPVKARVQHRTGIENYQVKYRLNGQGSWLTAPPSVIPPIELNYFEAAIPPQPGETLVEYYIEAQAISGKQQVRPITAPEGFYSFRVFDTSTVDISKITQRLFDLKAFPNPSQGITCIPLTVSEPVQVNIDLIDITGRLVLNIYQGMSMTGEQRYFFDSTNMASGTYFIRAQTKAGSVFQKLIIK